MKKPKCKGKKRSPHPQVAVKVNALVDEEIVPLVSALNEIPCVWTLDSCQGGDTNPATVFFGYMGPRTDEPAFFACLAKAMADTNPDDGIYTLSLEWYAAEQPLGKLACSPGAILRVAEGVRLALASRRMSQFLRDSFYKALGSSTDHRHHQKIPR